MLYLRDDRANDTAYFEDHDCLVRLSLGQEQTRQNKEERWQEYLTYITKPIHHLRRSGGNESGYGLVKGQGIIPVQNMPRPGDYF